MNSTQWEGWIQGYFDKVVIGFFLSPLFSQTTSQSSSFPKTKPHTRTHTHTHTHTHSHTHASTPRMKIDSMTSVAFSHSFYFSGKRKSGERLPSVYADIRKRRHWISMPCQHSFSLSSSFLCIDPIFIPLTFSIASIIDIQFS